MDQAINQQQRDDTVVEGELIDLSLPTIAINDESFQFNPNMYGAYYRKIKDLKSPGGKYYVPVLLPQGAGGRRIEFEKLHHKTAQSALDEGRNILAKAINTFNAWVDAQAKNKEQYEELLSEPA